MTTGCLYSLRVSRSRNDYRLWRAGRSLRLISQQSIVFRMVTDPEPQDPIFDINAERAVTEAYSA
jgi:hypothetical protein